MQKNCFFKQELDVLKHENKCFSKSGVLKLGSVIRLSDLVIGAQAFKVLFDHDLNVHKKLQNLDSFDKKIGLRLSLHFTLELNEICTKRGLAIFKENFSSPC